MITNRQKNFMILFITKAFFLGVGYSLIISKCNNDSWICFVIGSLIGLIFCFMLKKILDFKKDRNLTDILKEIPFFGVIARILLITLSMCVINEIMAIIKEFAKSFFLINSTPFLILLPLVILSTYVAFKGYNLLAYLSECLFPIGISLIIFAFISLVAKTDYTNLKPILSHSSTQMIKGIFFYFALSTSPLLLLLDMNFEDNNISNAYLLSSILLLEICILVIGVLGQFLIKIYRFPEYMVLKEIEIFNFIEKIENILSITWIIDAFFLLCTSSCFLKNMLPKKYNNYYFLGIMLTIFILACTLFGNSYIKDLFIYLYLPYILASISIPIIIILFMCSVKN